MGGRGAYAIRRREQVDLRVRGASGRESLQTIKDAKLRREVRSGISKFEARLGIQTRDIKLANLSGAHGSYNIGNNELNLNKHTYQNTSYKKFAESYKREEASGFKVRTGKPVQHTVVHELAHSVWTNHHSDKSAVAARKEIQTQYKKYLKAQSKLKNQKVTPYAKQNVNEFFAEKITGAIIGKGDSYGRALVRISKKYNLGRRTTNQRNSRSQSTVSFRDRK